MLKKHSVVKAAVEQLINTLDALYISNKSMLEKMNAVRWHSEHTVESINAILSKDKENPVISDTDSAKAIKLTIGAFKSALSTNVRTFISRDANGRRFTLTNMLERHLLLCVFDREIADVAKEAARRKSNVVYIYGNSVSHPVKVGGNEKEIASAIIKHLARNPYSTRVARI